MAPHGERTPGQDAGTYHALNAQEALRYALAHPPLATADAGSVAWDAREVGDGNLNLIFIVSGDGGPSAVIKQALPYVRLVGESWPLTLERNRFERDAYAVYAGLAPDLVPRVYHADDTLALFIMEDLSRLEVVRGGLVAGRRFPRLAGDIARFCAETAARTSDFYLGSAEKKAAVRRSINPELCMITEDLVFAAPFYNAASNSYEPALQPDLDRLWTDDRALTNVAALRYAFMTRAEALVHGDLHTGSIMGSPAETRVVDPEFCFYGPSGFDIGMFIANLYLSAVSHAAQRARDDQRRALARDMLGAAEETWSEFHRRIESLLAAAPAWQLSATSRAEFLMQILRDAVGVAGAEMIRRTVGLARVADLEGIGDRQVRIGAKATALHAGRQLLRVQRTIDAFQDAHQAVARILDK